MLPEPDLTPRTPLRPLIWPDLVPDLQERLADDPTPVWIVGGAVRDAYLHRSLHDLDLVTPDQAVALARKIARLMNGDLFILDAERDVARVILSLEGDAQAVHPAEMKPRKFIIDVAGFRGETLAADLRDRDFTFNAMAVDFKGDLSLLIDPLAGEQDITLKRVRQCKPDALTDDPIRMLRAVRLSAQFGFTIESGTLASIRSHTANLTQTSAERIRDEFFKILGLAKPTQPLRIAARLGLLQTFLPEIDGLINTAPEGSPFANRWDQLLVTIEKLHTLQASIIQRTESSPASFEVGMVVMQFDRYRHALSGYLRRPGPEDRTMVMLLILALMLRAINATAVSGQAVDAEDYADRLRLSNPEKQFLVTSVAHMQPIPLDRRPNRLTMHRYWYQFGEAGIGLLLIRLSEMLGAYAHFIEQDQWLVIVDSANTLLEAYFDHHDTIVSPPVLLDGTQLKQMLKLRSGPIIGQLLTLIREGQVTGTITSTEEALEQAREYISQQSQ